MALNLMIVIAHIGSGLIINGNIYIYNYDKRLMDMEVWPIDINSPETNDSISTGQFEQIIKTTNSWKITLNEILGSQF